MYLRSIYHCPWFKCFIESLVLFLFLHEVFFFPRYVSDYNRARHHCPLSMKTMLSAKCISGFHVISHLLLLFVIINDFIYVKLVSWGTKKEGEIKNSIKECALGTYFCTVSTVFSRTWIDLNILSKITTSIHWENDHGFGRYKHNGTTES